MFQLFRRRRDHIYACNEIQENFYEKKFERFFQDEIMSKFYDFRDEYTFISWFHDWKSRLNYNIIIECKEWLDYVDENEKCILIARVIARKHMYFLFSRNNDQWFSILDAQNIFIVSKIARLNSSTNLSIMICCVNFHTLLKNLNSTLKCLTWLIIMSRSMIYRCIVKSFIDIFFKSSIIKSYFFIIWRVLINRVRSFAIFSFLNFQFQ